VLLVIAFFFTKECPQTFANHIADNRFYTTWALAQPQVCTCQPSLRNPSDTSRNLAEHSLGDIFLAGQP